MWEGVKGTMSRRAAVFEFERNSSTKRRMSRARSPPGPASRSISTMCTASRNRMTDENWTYRV